MFKKYSSIENSYRTKFIDKFIDNGHPLQFEKYVVREKLDETYVKALEVLNAELQRTHNRITSLDGDEDRNYDILENLQEKLFKFLETAPRKPAQKTTLDFLKEQAAVSATVVTEQEVSVYNNGTLKI